MYDIKTLMIRNISVIASICIQVFEMYREGDIGGGFYCFTAQLLSEDGKVSYIFRLFRLNTDKTESERL